MPYIYTHSILHTCTHTHSLYIYTYIQDASESKRSLKNWIEYKRATGKALSEKKLWYTD